MFTKRLLGITTLAVVVILGVVGVDRLTKDARSNAAQQTITASNRGTSEARPARPDLRSAAHIPPDSIRFQIEPQASEPPPTPEPPTVNAPPPPPLVSTGELERQLKESLQR